MAANANKDLHMETMEDAAEKTLGIKEAGSAEGESLYVVIQPQGIRACCVESIMAQTVTKPILAKKGLLSLADQYASVHISCC